MKRWFPWACLVLMLAADIFLFRAIRQKDAVVLNLRDVQVELRETQDELNALKNSNVGLQASEILRLRKQNEILTNRFAGMEASLAEMAALNAEKDAENTSNAQHLAAARLAIQLQQEHLQELEAQTQRILLTAANLATNNAAIIAQKTCLTNLRRIDDAKQAWATENGAPDNAVPKREDLLPYFKGGVFPVCPSGGTYSINAVNEVPTCSYPGHALR